MWLAIIFFVELIALGINGILLLHQFSRSKYVVPSDFGCIWVTGKSFTEPLSSLPIHAGSVCHSLYPPPFLLIAAPLSLINPAWSYAIWTVTTSLLLVVAAKSIKVSWRAIGIGLLSPPTLLCWTTGQTGTIISALLIASLGLAERNPWLAGAVAGCTIIKPQYSILLPICFIASRNWRALTAASIISGILIILPLILLSPDVWREFFDSSAISARDVLEASWPQPFQHIMISVFIMCRSFGAGLRLAYLAQLIATSLAIFAVWSLWSRPHEKTPLYTKIFVTLCLIVLATPYAFIYDIAGMALILAGVMEQTDGQHKRSFLLLWVFSGLYFVLPLHFILGAAFITILVILNWPDSLNSDHSTGEPGIFMPEAYQGRFNAARAWRKK